MKNRNGIQQLASSRTVVTVTALVSLALLLALAPVHPLRAQDSTQQSYLQLVEDLNAMVPAAIAGHERIDPDLVTERVERFLSVHIPPDGITSLDDESAHLLFRAAVGATMFAPDRVPPLLEPLAQRVSAAEPGTHSPAAGPIRTPPLVDAYQRLINARDFGAARDFAHRHGIQSADWASDLEPKDHAQSGAATYLRLHRNDGNPRAEFTYTDVGTDTWMIVEAHPDCAFSRRAMAYFSKSAPLEDELPQGNILWVVPQDRSGAVPSILEWNASNPDTELVLAYRNRDWPKEISFLEYPVFNLFHDGELITKITGWPNDDQIEEIRAGIQSIDRER